jgi:hypothetical protein
MPDPASRDAVKIPPEAYQQLDFRKKASRCSELLPPAEPPKPDPAMMAEALKRARCMREHGVPEAQDPTAEMPGGLYVPPVDFGTKRFRDANKACTGKDSPVPAGGPAG